MTGHRWLWSFVAVAGLTVTASAQTPQLRFEVASVRRATPGETGGRVQFLPGGRFVAQNVPLSFLLQQAYGVRDFQIVAEPRWRAVIADGRDSRYYIEGRGPESATRGQLQEMVKTLLAERFGLKLHIEQRTLPVYTLVIAPRGVKGARPADRPAGGIALMARGWIRGLAVTTEHLSQTLSTYVDRPVVDRTKLDQLLEFDLTWTPADLIVADAPPDPGCPATFRPMAEKLGWKLEDRSCPSIFTAVEEQLGLKLDAQNAPLDVIVIDSVEIPTEN